MIRSRGVYEHVVWAGRPSWKGRLSILGLGLALAIAVLLLLLILGVAVAIVLVIAVGALVLGLLETMRWKYTFTNRRGASWCGTGSSPSGSRRRDSRAFRT